MSEFSIILEVYSGFDGWSSAELIQDKIGHSLFHSASPFCALFPGLCDLGGFPV